jgi:hypothetical protein
VPTPFSHIALCEQVLASPELPAASRRILARQRAAFLFGSTAPDAGGLAGLQRAATHFFEVPLRNRRPAHLRLLAQHPVLARPHQCPADQAAFLAGYLSHLWLDQLWISIVFQPAFGQPPFGTGFHQRLVEHNLLRAHLDRLDQTALPARLDDLLLQAEPKHWLPFLTDGDLIAWRDHLAEQVSANGRIRTLEVFADRLGLSTEAFARQLDTPAVIDRILAERLPAGTLDRFRSWSLAGALELVGYYLDDRIQAAPRTAGPIPASASTNLPAWDSYESHRAL